MLLCPAKPSAETAARATCRALRRLKLSVTNRTRHASRQDRLDITKVSQVNTTWTTTELAIFTAADGFGFGLHAAEGSTSGTKSVLFHNDTTINLALGFVNKESENIFGVRKLYPPNVPSSPTAADKNL